ncbi:head-tail connector protein [Paenibacillus larvae]|nr:head-tail connector protein [Paenibacillus larvae]MDT2255713.1 head-tail connector protein [Paenibacillus larvae]
MGNISLEEVKEYLRIDDDAGDQTLSTLLESAKRISCKCWSKRTKQLFIQACRDGVGLHLL